MNESPLQIGHICQVKSGQYAGRLVTISSLPDKSYPHTYGVRELPARFKRDELVKMELR